VFAAQPRSAGDLQAPATSARATVSSAAQPTADPGALSREQLERAIAGARAVVEGWRGGPSTPVEASLRLHGLGRAELEATQPPERALAALFAGWTASPASAPTQPVAAPGAMLSPLPPRQPGHALPETDPLATLSILLEAGVAFDQTLQLSSGPSSVRQLVDAALSASQESRVAGSELDPWELDLLAWATLGGLEKYRERLGQATQVGLTRLDRRQRTWHARQGTGSPEPEDVARLVDSWRQPPERQARMAELQLASAVFRAVAVLAETDLENQAQRYLNSLELRYDSDRALYQHLLTATVDPVERTLIRLDAIESLGRLEQALYGAHLSFRSRARPEPAPRTAALMQTAARDLRDQLQPLLDAGALREQSTDSPEARSSRLRAAVHALRGLRASRVAISAS
jgi:hypothetical protein